MRTFEERKAEIFRRSEERIRLRKKRQKQLLGTGVPLVCAVICLAVLLPGKADNATDELCSQQLDGLMDDAPAEMQEPVESGVPVEGCAPEEANVEETPAAAERKQTQADEQGRYGSDYEGIYLEVSEIDLDEGKIETFWSNHSQNTVHFGEPYDIQHYKNGEWISCATRILDWPMPEYELAAGEQMDLTYRTNLQWFDLSQPGTYRITVRFNVDGDSEGYALWAEFTLREEAEELALDSVEGIGVYEVSHANSWHLGDRPGGHQ